MNRINLKPQPFQNRANIENTWQNTFLRKTPTTENPWSFEPVDKNNDNAISYDELLATTPADVATAAQKIVEDIKRDNTSDKSSVVALGQDPLVAPQGLLSEIIKQCSDRKVYYGVDVPQQFVEFVKELNDIDFSDKTLQQKSDWIIAFQGRFFKAFENSFLPPLKSSYTDVWTNDPYNRDNINPANQDRMRLDNLDRLLQNSQKPQVKEATDEQKQGFWSMMDMLTTAKLSGADVFVYGKTSSRVYGTSEGHMKAANDLRLKSIEVPRGSIIIASMPAENALTHFAPEAFQNVHTSKKLLDPIGSLLKRTALTLNVRSYNIIAQAPENRILSWQKQALSDIDIAQLQTHMSTLPADGWDKTIYVKALEDNVQANPNNPDDKK